MNGKINIRPTTGVYATYQNLRYEPWTALAEFVDNSSQSFLDHENKLNSMNDFNGLYIEIDYISDKDGNDKLIIKDNAFGMELEDFERAIVLDKPPLNPSINSRNEYGMGLKTAACWFGKYWTVKSTQYGSEFGYSASVDVNKLAKDKNEEVDLDIFEVNKNDHYTIITIEKLNKKINGSRTIAKVKDFLSSIYREDIRNGKIKIRFKDSLLVYKDPEIYEEHLENGNTKLWKKEIDFRIPHQDDELMVKGFIALRIPASHSDAGFTLIRRGRVIIGGPDCNYRPSDIFGDSGSYTYQRLFGELHMDNWPVTQAKDNFDWHNEGLEEKLIEELKKYTKEYRDKAEKIRTRPTVKTKQILEDVSEELSRTSVLKNVEIIPLNLTEENIKVDDNIKSKEIEFVEADDKTTDFEESGIIIEGNKTAKITFEYKESNYSFNIEYDTSYINNLWLIVEPLSIEENSYYVKINMKHQFFYPLIDDPKFVRIITKFIIAMVLSEIEASNTSADRRVDLGDVRLYMNNILSEIVNSGGKKK